MSAPNEPFSVRLKDGSWLLLGQKPHEGGVYGIALVDREGEMRAAGVYLPAPGEYRIYVKASPDPAPFVADMETFKSMALTRMKPDTPVKVFTVR